MKKILIPALISVVFISFSATTTWKGYKEILSDYTVNASDILTIEAGTTLRFAPDVKLTVHGEIHATGTEFDPITFAPLDRSGLPWGGINIQSMSGNSDLSYSKFTLMSVPAASQTACINIDESACTINNCSFTNSSGDFGGALNITGGNVTVANSVFDLNNATYGGAIYILNDSSVGPSQVNITSCQFTKNESSVSGGAIQIQDNSGSVNNMDLNIFLCKLTENISGNGGGIYYDNQGKIDIQLEKCMIYSNKSFEGSGIYAKFMGSIPGAILAQRFSNILIFKNLGFNQSGIFIDMGLTTNPQNLKFTNATIAYNSIISSKNSKISDSGIHIKTNNGNFPKIANSIIWGNESNLLPSNFKVEDSEIQFPNLSSIFWYCDIFGYIRIDTNMCRPPVFVRAPEVIDANEPEEFDEDRYDFHLSLLSPCIDAGDPAEPCFEINSTRVNMGAYGNTVEATPKNFNIIPAASVNTTLNINGATVLDFQGKAIKLSLDEINLTSGSQLFLKSAQNSDITTKRIITPVAKFNESYAKIQTLRDSGVTAIQTPVQYLTVTDQCQLINSDVYNISLNIQKNLQPSNIIIQNSKFFVDSLSLSTNPIKINGAGYVNITGSKFIDCKFGGIAVTGDIGATGKTPWVISKNSINFNPNIAIDNKSGTPKRTGIEISEANVDVENNDIEGGDEGIVMKSNSSGRISNNTVSFDVDTASKKGIYDKTGIIVSENSVSSEISNNLIKNEDYETTNVTGIEINTSRANVLYNTLNFIYSTAGTRTGIKILSPSDTINIYNNTIYNTLQGFYSIPSLNKVNVVNNIYWTETASGITVNDSANFIFQNNCFADSTRVLGMNNIFADPDFYDTIRDDFTLVSTSPCVNAGLVIDGIHVFDAGKAVYYYGTAPDIGSEELYQELVAPSSVTASVAGTNFNLSWSPVSGFEYYKVYDSDVPYGTFTHILYHGASANCTAAIGTKKFFYVVATNEPPAKSYEPENIVAGSKENSSDKIKPDEPSKKKIRINKIPTGNK